MDKQILTDIHRYWFGELKSPADTPTSERMEAWFRPTVEIDNHIRDAFGHHIDEANATAWSLSALSREQQVGLVVLLDQFPRQIFRGSGQSFACDAKARTIANALLETGIERYFPVERTFIVLPLEHSEDIADQDRSVWYFAREAIVAPESSKASVRKDVDYATKHRDIIRKFGRFPHRNVMMGRQSTPEEIEFLKGGRGF